MIEIDKFVVDLMESDILSDLQKGAFRLILAKQFLECSDGKIRRLRQEYKFRYGDTVRRKSDGLEAKVKHAGEDGFTIVECEDRTEPILVDEWELVPIGPKFKEGDKIIRKEDASKDAYLYAKTIIGVETEERRYKLGECHYMGFYAQDDYELVGTHIDLTDANPQTRHQLLAIQATQHIEEWFNGLSDKEKEDFAERYPELVIRNKED